MKETLMNKMKVVAALAFTCCLTPVWAKPCPPGSTPSVAVLNNSNSVTGNARVCADVDGVHVTMDVRGLTPGRAYTVWFAYIDNPGLCFHPVTCDSDVDFFGSSPLFNPVVVIGRMDSAVAPRNGEAQFSGEISGMVVSHGSQLQILMNDHGPASSDLRERARQLLTPQDQALGTPGSGILNGPTAGPWGTAIVTFP
jgi:hypothetical protein